MRHAATEVTCGHCGKPLTDSAYLCHDGTAELATTLRWLTADVSRADREPTTETITVTARVNGQDITHERTTIVRHSFARLPSTIWDTPSGEAHNLPRILAESAARLARRTTHARLRHIHTEPPLPVDLRAVNNAGRIREIIARYATLLSGTAVPLDAAWDVSTVASWLIDETPTIRRHDWACAMLQELAAAIARAERHLDPPAERRYLGVCGAGKTPPDAENPSPGCQGQVFAIAGSPSGTCNRCAARYDVQVRQDARLEQLHGVRLTAAEIERVTTELGRPVSRKTITKWHERGRISMDGGGRYLVDDALRLAEQAAVRRSGATRPATEPATLTASS